ncbi:short chain dehydrogenase [Colletotrichum incanum]|uniref:Short chain dehydrogenase n=1 Tax=Colletotrichum incanum TaxID=1573173 RepID=A0A161VYY4_COLIC|nr:short chain dehydrogenase [Colletotrichum incanum]
MIGLVVTFSLAILDQKFDAGFLPSIAMVFTSLSVMSLIAGPLVQLIAPVPRPSLKQAAADTTEIVGERGIDYLIANRVVVPSLDVYGPIADLSSMPKELEAVRLELWQTNVVCNIHLIHLFFSFVLKGKVKKVIFISSGHADLNFTNALDVDTSPIYTASQAAMNAIMSKFSTQ